MHSSKGRRGVKLFDHGKVSGRMSGCTHSGPLTPENTVGIFDDSESEWIAVESDQTLNRPSENLSHTSWTLIIHLFPTPFCTAPRCTCIKQFARVTVDINDSEWVRGAQRRERETDAATGGMNADVSRCMQIQWDTAGYRENESGRGVLWEKNKPLKMSQCCREKGGGELGRSNQRWWWGVKMWQANEVL